MRFSSSFNRIIMIVVVLILILYVGSLIWRGMGTNWKQTWSGADEQPFGAEVLREAARDFLKPATFVIAEESPLDVLEEADGSFSAYVFVNDEFNPSSDEWQALEDFAYDGNLIWLATENFSEYLEEELEMNTMDASHEQGEWLDMQDSISVFFVRDHWPEEEYKIPLRYLYRLPSGSLNHDAEVLASTAGGQPVAVWFPMGDGGMFVSTFPTIITNYGLLRPEYETLVSGLLSVIPQGIETIYWDEWIKIGNRRRDSQDELEDESPGPLSYIWQHEALRMALLLSLLGLLLVGVFQTRRVQRIIPVRAPLPNMTLDFVETIGRLTFQQENHHQLALKRILVFKEQLKELYLLPDPWGSSVFIQVLAAKSGHEVPFVNQLIKTIIRTEKATIVTESELLELSRMIEFFRLKTLS